MHAPIQRIRQARLDPAPVQQVFDQARERIRYLHYSLQTEKVYVYWRKAFLLCADRIGDGLRHPLVLGQVEVEVILTMIATEKQVVQASTCWHSMRSVFFYSRY